MATKQSVLAQAPADREEVVANTVPFDGIPMTAAIAAGYPNAKTPAQVAALTRARLQDFKANMTWDYAVRIGVVNTGTPDAPVYEDRYEMKTVTVWPTDIVTGSMEYYNAVMSGNAYSPGTAPSTTVPPTTTAAP